MLTAYSPVTVVCGSRKVDLALPSALPVADVAQAVVDEMERAVVVHRQRSRPEPHHA